MAVDRVLVCALSDLPEEGAIAVRVGDAPVAVVRSEGEIYAIHDGCTHTEVPLSEGEVYRGVVECWLHGSCFDLRTGKAIQLPATEPVRTYQVEVSDDDVYVTLTQDDQSR